MLIRKKILTHYMVMSIFFISLVIYQILQALLTTMFESTSPVLETLLNTYKNLLYITVFTYFIARVLYPIIYHVLPDKYQQVLDAALSKICNRKIETRILDSTHGLTRYLQNKEKARLNKRVLMGLTPISRDKLAKKLRQQLLTQPNESVLVRMCKKINILHQTDENCNDLQNERKENERRTKKNEKILRSVSNSTLYDTEDYDFSNTDLNKFMDGINDNLAPVHYQQF